MLDEFYRDKKFNSLTLFWCIELINRIIAVRLDYFLGGRQKVFVRRNGFKVLFNIHI